MAHPNHTTNSGRCLYMRNDLWAAGHFDFLLERNYGTAYHEWVKKTKEESMRSLKPLSNKYPKVRA